MEDKDPVHFVLNVVTQVPDHQASVNLHGTGSAQYPPCYITELEAVVNDLPECSAIIEKEEGGEK